MNLKSLISASLLYGLADMVVLLVSGFLLLPLYTHTLTQADFGNYVTVRANTELLGYLLYLGVPSAMARLYFDHLKARDEVDYIGTLSLAFLIVAVVGTAVCWLVGDTIWSFAAPKTPASPYLWFCLATAILSFYSLVGTTWLRLDESVSSVVVLQLTTAVLLALSAWLALAVLGGGLSGLLIVLLLANLPAAVVVVIRLSRRFRRVLPASIVGNTLYLGLPIFFSYLCNFALNRINLLIMQHWVTIETLAVFGLATQLASLVTVASMSFSKAIQPSIFRAERNDLAGVLGKAGPVHIGIITTAALLLSLYVDNLIELIAPRSYGSAYDIVLVVVFANLIGSFSLISDTTLMYLKRPKDSMVSALIGGASSMALGLVLVPLLSGIGAAIALAVAFALKTLASQIFANRHVATATMRTMIGAGAAAAMALLAIRGLHEFALPLWISIGVKSAGLTVVAAAGYLILIWRRKVASR